MESTTIRRRMLVLFLGVGLRLDVHLGDGTTNTAAGVAESKLQALNTKTWSVQVFWAAGICPNLASIVIFLHIQQHCTIQRLSSIFVTTVFFKLLSSNKDSVTSCAV